jgi:hypothetical protein
LFALSLTQAASAFFESCGDYQVTGLLSCKEGKCRLKVYPGSRSETEIVLTDAPPIYADYDQGTIQVKIRMTQKSKRLAHTAQVLDSVPLRELPNPSSSAVKLLRSSACHS